MGVQKSRVNFRKSVLHKKDSYVGAKVLIAVTKSYVLWDITPCIPVKVKIRFGRTHRLRNVSWFSLDYTALYCRRQNSSH
jgi:hypothetical protein